MENAAYMEGYKAFKQGLTEVDNPYNSNPWMVFRSEWFKGWAAAYREDELFS